MKLPISWRLGVSFFVLILFSYALGYKGIASMQELKETTEAIYQHPFEFAKKSRDLHIDIQEVSKILKDALLSDNTSEIINLQTEALLTIEEIKKHQQILNKILIGESVSYTAYLATFEDFEKSVKNFLTLLKLGHTQEAQKIFDKKYMKYEKRLLLNIIALEEHADANALRLEEESVLYLKNSLETFKIILMIVTLFGILFSLFAYFHFIRPIRKFQALIENIAIGDTSHEIYALKRKDELGDIARSIEILSKHIQTITLHTDKIAHGDFSVKLETLSDKDILAKSIQVMTQNLKENFLKNQQHNWIQTGKEDLSIVLRENEDKQSLGDKILIVLAEYTSAQIATLYLFDGDILKLSSSYAYSNNSNEETTFALGEGLVGQVAMKNEMQIVEDIPNDYIQVKSGLGTKTPNTLILMPFLFKDNRKGVVEFGYFGKVEDKVIEFLEEIRENLGIAYESIDSRIALNQAFLEEQAVSEELQAQEEELRVSNEKLQEQSEKLQSQKRRLEDKSTELVQKAVDLEQASKYKSEFLANMSHELRTPLNSLLLLSQSLASNSEGNLNGDEVESAQVINESGEHLLGLINDILDISKVEAGQMQLNDEIVEVDELSMLIKKRFSHMAEEKDIFFEVQRSGNFPKSFRSDTKKLEQILTNLIANALKFTSKGGVSLMLEHENNNLNFRIKDSGIGIPEDKQKTIFEAFSQADGSTSRNFGGTGLGLSIAMSFSKLIGARIDLKSEEGVGSIFTISLPFSNNTIEPKEKSIEDFEESSPIFEDDREHIDKGKALFLIIEDDEQFAKILYNHCHKHGDQVIIANDGETGILLAQRYDVKGILLDYMLPKMDGLKVLEMLKSDNKTTNIPVHVMSALDDLADMKTLGAVGQDTKPVSSTQINNILDSFSLNNIVDKVDIFTNKVKKSEYIDIGDKHEGLVGKTILLVDDDMRNIYSLAKLFRAKKIEVHIAPSGKKALEILSKHNDVDIILMDIMMPEMDGHEVTRAVREIANYKEVPIIAVTANAMVGDKEKCLESGANDYMSKPIDLDKLFVMMQMWLA